MPAQEPDSVPTLHIHSTLTLVDGVIEQKDPKTHNPALLTKLTEADFRLFDNKSEVQIKTFDTGVNTRPIALWLIVQCDMGLPIDYASMYMKGKVQDLKPALRHLVFGDLIGVAHWCDDGVAKVDVVPGTSIDAALQSVDAVLAAGPFHRTESRSGEIAMQQMIRMIVESTKAISPSRLPVLLFLYGDVCGTKADEAERIVSALYENSGMVFGLGTVNRNTLEPRDNMAWYLVHYYSARTGGEYYSASRTELFAPALNYIVTQLHLRYTLGFEPANLDGKPHNLRVELTKDAQERFPKTTLRFRGEYIPLTPSQ